MKKWAFILCLGLASCYTEQKAKNQFSKAAVSYPKLPIDYCADHFFVKPDSIIVKTDTITEIIFMDSLVNNTDTLYRDSLGFKYRTIYKTQKIYIKKDSIIYRENTAALKACEIDKSILTGLLKEQTALAAKYKGQANKRGWMFWGLIFLVVGAIGMRLYLKSKSIIK